MSLPENRKQLIDKIQDYYLNESKLTDHQRSMVERIELVFSLSLNARDKKTIISKYAKILSQKGIVLSIPQAYRDLKMAEEVFSPILEHKKDFLRMVMIESANKDISRIQNRLKKAKSNREFIDLQYLKDRIETRLMKLAGLDKPDNEVFDFSKLTPHQFLVKVDPRTVNMLKSMASNGFVDLTGSFEDADWEEMDTTKE